MQDGIVRECRREPDSVRTADWSLRFGSPPIYCGAETNPDDEARSAPEKRAG